MTNEKVKIPEAIKELCAKVTAKRPRTVINHIIKHGFISTEDLKEKYGYDHPPRAVRDVREHGIPLKTFRVQSKTTGRMIAAYKFDDPANIVAGRIGGRIAFAKEFKKQLVSHLGSKCTLTGEVLESRYLQIDHRIPYQVAGDGDSADIKSFMLLDASSQRAKSWSCEQCKNFSVLRDPKICNGCFWAFPESYKHVAMKQERRLALVWQDGEVAIYEGLEKEALKRNKEIHSFVKEVLAQYILKRR